MSLSTTKTSLSLETLARRAFDFFWQETHPQTGLTKDRAKNSGQPDEYTVASIAATGYALAALPIAASRRWVKKADAQQRALLTLRFVSEKLPHEHGFFYHFIDWRDGKRVWSCEISSIDSTLLFLGALATGRYFGGECAKLADALVARADWPWMQNRENRQDGAESIAPSMGWKPESGFLSARWSGYTEASYLYFLALGTPTHPLPQASWDALSFTENPAVPIFWAQMTPGYVNVRGLKDRQGRDWWGIFQRSHEYHVAFCAKNAEKFTTYREGIFGINACDQPSPVGYGTQSPRDGDHDGTVAPTGAMASILFIPKEANQALTALQRRFGEKITGRYGLANALNADKSWFDTDVIGIDLGMALLAWENSKTGLLWKLVGEHPYLKKGLKVAGFTREPQPRAL
jgi:hypothetical protein